MIIEENAKNVYNFSENQNFSSQANIAYIPVSYFIGFLDILGHTVASKSLKMAYLCQKIQNMQISVLFSMIWARVFLTMLY